MTIAQALYEFLTEQSSITAIVSDRIYPVELPQQRNETPGGEVFNLQDSIVFGMTEMSADDGINSNAIGQRSETWEIICLSKDHAQAHEMKDAVASSLRNYLGPMPASGGVENAAVQFIGGRDEFDSEFRVYAVIMSFSITP